MKYLKKIVLLAAAGAVAGCAWKQTPVPVIGESTAIAALVGSWSGEYSSAETGRSGTITFQLASVRDTAYGDVFMIPRDQSVQAPSEERTSVVSLRAPNSGEPLKIRFVRLEGGRVSGTLDPYKDPTCGCTLFTTFDGVFTSGDMIEGSFQTRGGDFGHAPSAGRFKVGRR